jgi:hypothetical protein
MDASVLVEEGGRFDPAGGVIVSAESGGVASKCHRRSPPGDGSGGRCATRLRRGKLLRMAKRARRGRAVLSADRLAL